MKDFKQIKLHLHKACTFYVNERLKTVTNTIESNQKDLLSETKSSAGDKHETGRAMLQLEMEKAGQQLATINDMKSVLSKIVVENISEKVCLGSLIITNKANYYLAISAGKLTVDAVDYFAVSTSSPIGKQLLGKKKGDIIAFNSAEIQIVI
ncbi:3-oxoacyl-ACP synthase [Lutibacter sp. HS1-25]|uniref:3-oxoacyl-ACP synthase n=1 Tax=Lutibacter sp. HS1-25 TaxID=2485000 RepID=UPI0010113A3E|nr:3-oxoacyl-ACP synthase [Lutibacter sp. HS1-25]RXP54306.1 3-oxoacyl-ACP synthase [Lutibacter sp. HS1-25]